MTRPCRSCKRDRLVPDEIANNQNTCRACARKHRRALRKPCAGCGSRLRRPPRTRYCKTCRRTTAERHREASRRYYETLRADPERWAAFLEQKRLETRLRLERQGRPARPIAPEKYPSPSKWWRVPAEPLGGVLRTWPTGIESLCLAAHVDPMIGYRIVAGTKQAVTVATADALCVAAGLHLDLIYDDVPVRGTRRSPFAALATS